jgi:hypothetical protein
MIVIALPYGLAKPCELREPKELMARMLHVLRAKWSAKRLERPCLSRMTVRSQPAVAIRRAGK